MSSQLFASLRLGSSVCVCGEIASLDCLCTTLRERTVHVHVHVVVSLVRAGC